MRSRFQLICCTIPSRGPPHFGKKNYRDALCVRIAIRPVYIFSQLHLPATFYACIFQSRHLLSLIQPCIFHFRLLTGSFCVFNFRRRQVQSQLTPACHILLCFSVICLICVPRSLPDHSIPPAYAIRKQELKHKNLTVNALVVFTVGWSAVEMTQNNVLGGIMLCYRWHRNIESSYHCEKWSLRSRGLKLHLQLQGFHAISIKNTIVPHIHVLELDR